MSRVKLLQFVVVLIAMVSISWLLGYAVLAADLPRLAVLALGIVIGAFMSIAWGIFWHYVPTARTDAPYRVSASEHGFTPNRDYFTPNRDYFDPAPPNNYIIVDVMDCDDCAPFKILKISIADPAVCPTDYSRRVLRYVATKQSFNGNDMVYINGLALGNLKDVTKSDRSISDLRTYLRVLPEAAMRDCITTSDIAPRDILDKPQKPDSSINPKRTTYG